MDSGFMWVAGRIDRQDVLIPVLPRAVSAKAQLKEPRIKGMRGGFLRVLHFPGKNLLGF
jgi:hypothetical protein